MSNTDKPHRKLCEAVADLTWLYVEAFNAGTTPQPKDSRDLIVRVTDWAEEFTTLHEGETWEEKDYLTDIEEFFDLKVKDL